MADNDKKTPNDLAQLKDENAALKDRLANIEKLLALQVPVTTPLKVAQDREVEFEKKKLELTSSCQVRTQAEARRLWQEKTEYPVKVADVPEILVPARSPEEARGRYDVLCGILGVDPMHKYVIGAPVPAQATAHQAAA